MAAERAQQDGYPSSKDRRISDSSIPANKMITHHDAHHSNARPAPQHRHSIDQHYPPHHPDQSVHPAHHVNDPKQSVYDVSRAEFEQFQQQVSYNYECIQEHKRNMVAVENSFAWFQRDFTRAIDDLRSELRSRAPASSTAAPPGKHDSRDVEVLASQVTTITTKVNEIDNIKIQLQLLKTKLERLESEPSSHSLQVPAHPLPRPGTASSLRHTSPNHEGAPQPQQPSHTHAPPHGPHQPLPPIQTGALQLDSHRHQNYQHNSMADPAALRGDARSNSTDLRYPPTQRSSDALPPPSSIPAWRPGAGPTNYMPADQARDNWNGQHSSKRPYDELPAAREHSAPASPKRPKLAPLKPRNGYDDAAQQHPGYPPSENVPYHPGTAARQPPHEGPPLAPQLLATPASATPASSPYRFITSTLPAENHENWRSSDDSAARTRAANRNSSKGRTRPGDDKEHESAADWEHKQADWHGRHYQHGPPPAMPTQQQQRSPSAYYASNGPRAHAPGPPGPPPPPALLRANEHAPEYPLTPIASAGSPHEPSLHIHESITPFSGKKTRTKPIRNSEGILIRKDGRPDMRSVSSANNLRKVHAKKEAERAETDSQTPVSARPLAPSQSNSVSEDDVEEEQHAADGRSATPPEIAVVVNEPAVKESAPDLAPPVTGLVTPAEDKKPDVSLESTKPEEVSMAA